MLSMETFRCIMCCSVTQAKVVFLPLKLFEIITKNSGAQLFLSLLDHQEFSRRWKSAITENRTWLHRMRKVHSIDPPAV